MSKQRWWARRKRAFAHPTNFDDTETQVRILAACIFARGLLQSLALRTEGAGRPGARCALSPRVQRVVVDAHALAGHTGITRHSPRNGLRIMACSPWCTGFLATIARGGLAANLTPASRSRDHTHFPSASGALVKSTLRVHHSPPRVVDVGQRPHNGVGW